MTLRECSFLADENISPEVVAFLRARGCDTIAVTENELVGSDDVDLIRLAHAEGRVVLSHDSDFGTLAVTAGEPVVGIVYLRPGHASPLFTIETLSVVFSRDVDLHPPFILVARRISGTVNIRVRNL